MDLRLLALLLFSFHSQALSADEGEGPTSEGIPNMLLSTLVPTVPAKDPGTAPPTPGGITHDAPEQFHTTTRPTVSLAPPTDLDDTDSSEELVDHGCEAYASHGERKRALGHSIMGFGLQLLDRLKSGAESPSVIVSPLSVSVALSQLALGAAGDTENKLLRSLQVDWLPCYHKLQRHLLRQLRGQALQLASRLYLKPGFEVKPAFLTKSQSMYGSHPAPLSSLADINEWVEKATKGQVTDFLSSMPSGLVLMLINAIHFKGEWETRFDPRFTSKEAFHIDHDHMVMVDMMHAPKYPLSSQTISELDAQVARIPFKNHMSLLVVMPMSGKVNVSTIAAHLNISDLYNRFTRTINTQVKLPKFKAEYSQDLQQALSTMGLQELFTGPDLSGIAEGPLLVSSVQHKSTMELSEEGAEATAVTSVAVLRSRPTFNLNQPFFFALMEDRAQVPVFLGVVTNPSPGAPIELRKVTDFHIDKSNTLDDQKGDSVDDKLGDTHDDKLGDRHDDKMDTRHDDKMGNKLDGNLGDKVVLRSHKGPPK